MDCSPWNSPGQNTGVGSPSLLQRIFPTKGSNPGLLHCRQVLYQLSCKGSPRILERVAYSFSSGASRPWNWTRVSCIAGGFFTNWAVREAPYNSCQNESVFFPKVQSLNILLPHGPPLWTWRRNTRFEAPPNPIPNTKTHLSYRAHVTIGTCCWKNRTQCWLVRLCLMTHH